MNPNPAPLLALLIALVLAAPAAAETKLFVRLDSNGAQAKGLTLRVKNTDGQLLKTVPSGSDSGDATSLDAWDDRVPPPDKRFHEFHLEISDGERVVARAKLAVDVRQAIQLLGHEPSTLRQFADAERGSIDITLYPPGSAAQKARQRYEAATCKECPELFATIEHSGKLPIFQPVLHSELKPSNTPPDERRDVLYSSLEVARCVRLVSDNTAPPAAEYRPAVIRRYDDWMTKNSAALRDKSLSEIALPGTHDSGAWELSDRKSPERSTAEWLAGLSMNITKPWAITQRLDIRGQLEGGIRWLDMRTAYDGSDFYFHHALLGTKTRDMLRQIRRFIDAPGHEHELIVLEFCNWQGFSGGDLPDNLWQRLGEMILAELGEENIYRKGASGAAQSDAELLKMRLGEILTGSKSRVIVFFQGHTDQAPFVFDAYAAFGGSYADRHLWSKVEADQKAKLAAHRSDKLFVLSWTVTVNQETISADLANRSHPECPAFDLEYLTRGGQADEMRQIAGWPGHEKINVVICDFFDSSPLLPLCFKLNGLGP